VVFGQELVRGIENSLNFLLDVPGLMGVLLRIYMRFSG
jgi:hypothetical protein